MEQISILSFDGQDDYVQVNDPFKNNTDFTISLWVKPLSIDDGHYHGFIGKQGDAHRKPGMWVSPSNGGLHYDSYDVKGQRYSDILNDFFTSKDWVHIVWVKQGTSYLFYRNGELFATRNAPASFYTVKSSYWIGRIDNFFHGDIDEVRIWDRAQSQSQIKETMNCRLTGKETGLSGYWPLSASAGTKAEDLSPNANHGEIYGAKWETASDLILLEPTPVLSFDGQDDYVQVNDPFQNNTDFTISLWVRPLSINDGHFHGFIGKQGDAYRKPGMWVSPSNGGLHYWSNDVNGQIYGDILNGFFTSKDWVHIVWVKQGTSYLFYRNGELFATRNAPASFYTVKSSYWIGRIDNFFHGDIDEVRIWDRAQSQSQIKETMNRRLTGKETGLMAYWPLSACSGTKAEDLSPNANHGEIYGAKWGTVSDLVLLEPVDSQNPVDSYELIDVDVSELPEPFGSLAKKIVDSINSEIGGVPVGNLKIDSDLLGDFDVISSLVGVDLTYLEIEGAKLQILGEAGVDLRDGSASAKIGLRITGKCSVFGLPAVDTKAELFLDTAGNPSAVIKLRPDCSWGVGAVFPNVPIVSAMVYDSPAIVLSSTDINKDEDFPMGITKGFNAYGDIPLENSQDKMLAFISGILGAKKIGCHGSITKLMAGLKFMLEAALEEEVTIIQGGDIFNMKYLGSEVAIVITGTPPEPSIAISNDMKVTMKWVNAEDLYFTGSTKLEAESITSSYTMNKTGSGGKEWKEPFGIPGIIIRNLAVQIGFTYAPPWIDDVGIAGDVKIGTIDGSAAILVDVNDPDQFVIACKIQHITMLEIMSFMSPPTFIAYQALPSGLKDTLNNVVDVSLQDVDVNIVPSATKIGELEFNDEGVTVKGILNVWGWNARVDINVASDNILVDAVMDKINISNVFKIEGAQGEPNPRLHLQIGTGISPDLYISSKIYLLGISKELLIKGDTSGFTFLLEDKYGGSILTTKLQCEYGNGALQADGRIDFKIDTIGPVKVAGVTFIDAIPINTGFDADASIRIADGFLLKLSGSLQVLGKNLPNLSITLNAPISDFKALSDVVVSKILDSIAQSFTSIFPNVEEWANAVKNGAIQFAGDIASVAKGVFNASMDEAVKAYQIIGKGVNEIASGLKTVYGATSDAVAIVLKGAGYTINEVGRALSSVYHLGADGLAIALKGAGYAVDEVGTFLKDVGGYTEDVIKSALGAAGYAADEIEKWIESIFPHVDIPHVDIPHADTHVDTPHADTHVDTPYADTHVDFGPGWAHVDTHTGIPHVDTRAGTPHVDTHAGTPHVDIPHVDAF